MSMKVEPDLVLNTNSAQIVATLAIVTLRCCCVKNRILMGQMGVPIQCDFCKRIWFVSSTSQIKIQEVVGDVKDEFSKALSV